MGAATGATARPPGNPEKAGIPMTIRTITPPAVKPTRTSPRPASRFGQGILRWVPTPTETHSAADEAWYIAEQAAAFDRAMDHAAGVAAAQSMVDAGLAVL